jgi:hypothetical protein
VTPKAEIRPEGEIVLDYYPGAYGPTIRLGVRSLPALGTLKDLFLSMAEGKVHQLVFEEMLPARRMDLGSLTLRRLPDDQEEHGTSITRVTLGTERDKPCFEWIRTSQGWRRCAGLVEGLINYAKPGHQYLSEEGRDNIVIELSFQE